MTAHQTIPYPKLTGDAQTDISNLHEYTYKLQEILLFTLQNLDISNINRNALGACEMRLLEDGGLWIGSKLENGKPGSKSNGIVIYARRGAKKIINGAISDI